MLSKELLYTAITRQKDKLIILYNEKAWKLKEYSSFAYSEVARRFTCLFEKPDIVGYKKRYYENKLIHKTVKGEMVRSKSEVIIANMLHDAGIEYEYERELDLKEDGTYIPDFTIDDAESGVSIYWEHCGLPGDPGYNIRWEKKKAVYEKHGIIEGENLIVTKDALDGSIDSAGIKAVLDKYF
jgi:hypothetical protein